jgi:Helicase conserved C-terminal domain/SNF2-related domain
MDRSDHETRHSLETLCAHFEIPEVADVAALSPKRYQQALEILDEIECTSRERFLEASRSANGMEAGASTRSEPFSWRQFQRDDLARFSLHPGGIFAWDKGGGKGLALYAIPRLYRARRVLIVAPEGLHDQICTEWREKFGFAPRRVMTVADIDADPELKAAMLEPRSDEPHGVGAGGGPGKGRAWKPLEAGERPLFWLTSYTALGFNGADEWPDEVDEDSGEQLVSKRLLKARLNEGLIPGFEYGIGEERTYEIRDGKAADIQSAEPSGVGAGGGQERGEPIRNPQSAIHTIRCVWKPSLAALLWETFDCVECDEAVRLKSTDSYISLGVRRMRPRFPVALTGTPVKNRLEDLFWLAHWTSGSPEEGNARFPFPNNSAARERFADLYMVMEENHTRREKYRLAHGRAKRFTRRLPQISNVHALWRVLGSIVLRRTKKDFGEEIVAKSIVPVSVKPGRAQQEVYRFHLAHPPTEPIGRGAGGSPGKGRATALDPAAALLAQLNNLRQAALSPDSPSLRRGDFPASASWTDHSPLFAGACELIEQQLTQGEQVMLASPFTHFNVSLEARLREAGVSCVRLDGQTQATERGRLAREFKARRFSVLIAGQQAMGEGHSFDQCSTLILPSLHWAMDINSQVEDRVHRLTSRKDVTIYVLSVANTISEQLLTLYREKSAASAAAVDGRLFAGPDEEEVSLGQLLRNARAHFNAATETIDETALESGWPDLRERLRAAEAAFRVTHPVAPGAERPVKGKRARPVIVPLPSGPVPAMPVKLPPPRGPLATAIRNMPTMTLVALLGNSDKERLARVRSQFEAFAATTDHTDWRRAWTAFTAIPLAHRERFMVGEFNPETETEIEEPKPCETFTAQWEQTLSSLV